MASKHAGFSLVESLIAIAVLSGGVVLYTKNWTANYGATSSTHVRSMAATQVAEIGNIMLANISDLDRDTPRGQIIARVQQFSNQLSAQVNSYASARGYTCQNSRPSVTSNQTNNANLNNSTLPRTWAQGAASCIRITAMPNKSTQTNGIWVQIEANWIDAHTKNNEVESVSVYTLVSPL